VRSRQPVAVHPLFSLLTDQRGQSSIFVLSLTGVILLCAIFLFQSGRVTSQKMQLQNAADAAAYGASVLEARALNFAAYTNRAMVANEVAIGQMVGILSWIDELKSMGTYTQIYADAIDAATSWLYAIITVGDVIAAIIDTITEVLAAVGETLEDVGEALESALDPIASVIIRGLSTINLVYSSSQTIYHGATIVLVTTNIFKCLEDNVPGTSFNPLDFFKKDKPGAQLSDLGIIALAGHIPSFWSGYTTRYTQDSGGKKGSGEEAEVKETARSPGPDRELGTTAATRKKDGKRKKGAKKKKDRKKKHTLPKADEGMSRMAATIRLARDPFSTGGPPVTDLNIYGSDMEYDNRNWRFGLGHDFHYDVDILDLHLVELKGDIDIFFGIDSKGGTEIRYKDGTYVWSALDTVLAGGELEFSSIIFKILDYKYDIKGGSIDLGLPLGGGGYQAAGSTESSLNVTDMIPPLPYQPGKDKIKSYGSSGYGDARLAAYTLASVDLEENTVKGNPYGGLRPYRDMSKVEVGREEDEQVPPEDIADQKHVPFIEPYFLVGVTRDAADITGKAPAFAGPLDLINPDERHPLLDKVAVIARSELYFKRPTDLFYFLRKDKMTEKPNVFSPFWQARLAETSDIDRFLALALQQHTIWLSGRSQQDIPGLQTIVDMTETFLQDLEDIFNIF